MVTETDYDNAHSTFSRAALDESVSEAVLQLAYAQLEYVLGIRYKGGKKMNKLIYTGAIAGLLIISGCKTEKVKSFFGTGTIEATEIRLSGKIPGEIDSLAVDEGYMVKKGQLIALIDVEQTMLQKAVVKSGLAEIDWSGKVMVRELDMAKETLTQSNLALTDVERNYQRILSLYNDKAATKEQLDKIQTEKDIARSRLDAAKKNLETIKTKVASLEATRDKTNKNIDLLDYQISQGTVTSPVDGVVIEKFTERGENVPAGTPIVSVADLSKVWLTIYLGETDLGKVKIGGDAYVKVDSYPDRKFPGKITWISPKAEFTPKNVQTRDSREDLVYAAKITLDNPEGVFKIGMPAEAYIEGTDK